MKGDPHKRKHLFHLVIPSQWPFMISLGIFFFLLGIILIMHDVPALEVFLAGSSLKDSQAVNPAITFFLGFFLILLSAISWFYDIVQEGTYKGDHSLVVRAGLKYGFMLFIMSEIMLFFGFFWAFFHTACSPSIWIGGVFPSVGIYTVNPFQVPLFNTLLLVTSGFFITVSHNALSIKSSEKVIKNLLIAIIFGLLFLINQVLEYYETFYSFSDSVYAGSFFMLTGLHGCHVIVGVGFLIVCLIRLWLGHSFKNHYLGYVFAIWYWHFVDIVWILLYILIYYWFG